MDTSPESIIYVPPERNLQTLLQHEQNYMMVLDNACKWQSMQPIVYNITNGTVVKPELPENMKLLLDDYAREYYQYKFEYYIYQRWLKDKGHI